MRILVIPKKASFNAITESLYVNDVIRNRFLFNLAARLLGKTTILKAGKYGFRNSMSNLDILDDLEKGTSRQVVSVVIPEGWRLKMIAERLNEQLGINEERFLKLCIDKSFINQFNLNLVSLEGYLMPDTYQYFFQPDEEEIITELLSSFLKYYEDSLKTSVKKSGMTLHQVLTLASIVEAETSIPNERSRIAGVYFNRLKKRMRLEADPTVQYLLEGKPRRLHYGDYRRPTPYNTYVIYGLPPGPINSPSKKSIWSVLQPEKHNFYYFVADGKGGHRFSSTLEEHKRAVQLYRKERRENQRQLRGQTNQ
jgi:UPF0755 protein